MSRPLQLLLFLCVAGGILGGVHYYVFTRLARDLVLLGPARTTLALVLGGLFLLMMSAMPLSRALPRSLATPLSYAAFIWMGTLMLLTLVLFAGDLVRLLLSPLPAPRDPERRAFLSRLLGLGSLGAAGVLAGVSLWGGLRRVGVRHLPVVLKRLPRELHGLRLVQLSDVHIGPTIDGVWLQRVVEQVNALSPDVIAITGDLVDGSVAALSEHVRPLSQLRARHGVFFVTGNHEYYAGVEEWLAHLKDLGLRVLRNERVSISVHPEGPAIDLAGIDDHHSHRFPGHGPDLPRALAGRDPERAVILLAHQPAAVEEAAAHGVDLQLSGHTHGGQIWPWRYMVRLQQPYIAGLSRHPGSETQIYVSSGTGYWGPPMRLGAPAEITHVTLLSEGA